LSGLVAGVQGRQRAGATCLFCRARAAGSNSFQPSGNAIAELAALTYDGYRDIRFNADSTLLARRQAAF
jgi:glucan biosynthesis protein